MTAVIILAAGSSKRFNSKISKILHPIGTKPILQYILDAAEELTPQTITIVASPGFNPEPHLKLAPHIQITHQLHPRGTGDAAQAAMQSLQSYQGNVVIICGDTPLITGDSLKALINYHIQHASPLTVAGFYHNSPHAYGRLILNEIGTIKKIVEAKDANVEEAQSSYCNAGVYVCQAELLSSLLPQISAQNAAKEYYLTDIVGLAVEQGHKVHPLFLPETEFLGVNTRQDLVTVTYHMQQRWRQKHLNNGVTLINPETVYFNYDTILGKDTVVFPNVVFGAEVVGQEGVTIYANCVIEHTLLQESAKIGPFAHLRGHTIIGSNAEVGNFVEIKKTILYEGAKVKHLSYLGDATIGAKANIGAGTITCNYNGFTKAQTHIGQGAFIGSNTSLIAPIEIGKDAIVGAGSVITQNVPEGALALARSKQTLISEGANRFRALHRHSRKESSCAE